LKIDCKSNVETLTTKLFYSRLAQVFLDIMRVKQLNGFYRETVLFIVKNSSSSNIYIRLWHEPKYILNLYYETGKTWTLINQTTSCSLQNTGCGAIYPFGCCKAY